MLDYHLGYSSNLILHSISFGLASGQRFNAVQCILSAMGEELQVVYDSLEQIRMY